MLRFERRVEERPSLVSHKSELAVTVATEILVILPRMFQLAVPFVASDFKAIPCLGTELIEAADDAADSEWRIEIVLCGNI